MNTRHLVVILAAACGTVLMVASARADTAGEADLEIERDIGIAEDPNLDHAWLMPTAMTQPRGAWKMSSTEVLFLGLSYGVTDDLGVTLGALPRLDGAYTGWLTAKYRFLRAGRFSLAAHGSTGLHHHPAYRDDFDEQVPADSEVLQTLGLAASYCIDRACRSLLSAYGGALLGVGDENTRFGLLGTSAIADVGGHVKVMVEADHGNQFGWAADNGSLYLWYGIRVAGPSIAVDIGVLDGLGSAVFDDGSIQLGRVPWFKIAYRAL